MRRILPAAIVAACALFAAPASAGGLFDYDTSGPLNAVYGPAKTLAPNVTSRAVEFAGHDGKTVKGEIIAGNAKGAHPGVLFVHWLGEPQTTNHTEFEGDAIALARRGVTSVLIDALWSDAKWFDGVGHDAKADIAQAAGQVIDMRRALDLLEAQPGVDKSRIALVAHDFGAMFGALMLSADTRPRAFVGMAAVPTFSEWYLLGKKSPAEDYATLLDTTLDITGALKAAKAKAYLLQFATKDHYVPAARAQMLVDATPLPKGVFYYETDHALAVEAARVDRLSWLQGQLFR